MLGQSRGRDIGQHLPCPLNGERPYRPCLVPVPADLDGKRDQVRLPLAQRHVYAFCHSASTLPLPRPQIARNSPQNGAIGTWALYGRESIG